MTLELLTAALTGLRVGGVALTEAEAKAIAKQALARIKAWQDIKRTGEVS